VSQGNMPTWMLIALPLVAIPIVGGAIWMGARPAFEPEAPAQPLLSNPGVIVPALEAEVEEEVLAGARKLTVMNNHAMLLAETGNVPHRLQITQTGSVLRRGGATRVAAEPFDVRRLDMTLVTRLAADARERTGEDAYAVVVGRDEDGRLLWRVDPGGYADDVHYDQNGKHLPDPFGTAEAQAAEEASAEESEGTDPLLEKVCAAYDEMVAEGVDPDVLLQSVAVRAVTRHGVSEEELAELGARPAQLLESIRSRGNPEVCAGFVTALEARLGTP